MYTETGSLLVTRYPTMYSLELTPSCNNNCGGCLNEFSLLREKNGKILSPSDWREIFPKILPHTHRVRLTGGEPTLYYGFYEIVDYLRSWGKPFHIFTNARWSAPQLLLDTLGKASNFVGLLISLHGPNALIHDRFTGINGSFDETLQNMKKAKQIGIRFNICIVLKNYNYSFLTEMSELALSFGAKLIVNRYYGLPIPDEDISVDEFKTAINNINELKSNGMPIKYGNCVPQCFHKSSSNGCTAGLTWCSIDPWGRVHPCDHAPEACGDLKTQDIKDIWKGTKMNKWRFSINSNCVSQCSKISLCRGGCKAVQNILGLDSDPLMQQPIKTEHSTIPVSIVELPSNGIISPNFSIDEEDFGFLLVCKGKVLPVDKSGYEIICHILNHCSIGFISKTWGDVGLDLVWNLYRRGFINIKLDCPRE